MAVPAQLWVGSGAAPAQCTAGSAHLLHTVACSCLIPRQTLLEGLKGLRTGLADLMDNWVVGGASSNAHLEVVTVLLPGLGGHTLSILVHLPAIVAGSVLLAPPAR